MHFPLFKIIKTQHVFRSIFLYIYIAQYRDHDDDSSLCSKSQVAGLFSHVNLCRPAMLARLGGSQVRACCAQLLRECCALAVAFKRVVARLSKVNLSAYYCAKQNEFIAFDR